jgi:hypothetical protein
MPLPHPASTLPDTDIATPSLPSCHPVASPPERSCAAAPSSQVVATFARHPPHNRAALTATAPVACHTCHSARMQACKHTLEHRSPLYPLPNAPLHLLLHAHARTLFSSAVELAPPPPRRYAPPEQPPRVSMEES